MKKKIRETFRWKIFVPVFWFFVSFILGFFSFWGKLNVLSIGFVLGMVVYFLLIMKVVHEKYQSQLILWRSFIGWILLNIFGLAIIIGLSILSFQRGWYWSLLVFIPAAIFFTYTISAILRKKGDSS